MSVSRMPAAEVSIDAVLVGGLLADQHPDLSSLEIVEVGCGWDNAIFRLGEQWLVRLPRRAMAVQGMRNELRWLPRLAPRIPLPIPVPVRRGVPGRGFPWPWSVCPWFDGETAAETPLELPSAALELGAFLAALHVVAPADAPSNRFRGGLLEDRSPALAERTAALGDALDTAAVDACWADALAAGHACGPAVWLHGDLHPANLVVRDKGLAAVLDFGDITSGDPAADLAVAWMLFPPELRSAFRAAAGGCDEATWRRARGWALSHAIGCLANSADNPRIRSVGARTLAAVLADPPR